MKVFKFGGASVKNAQAVVNVGNIIRSFAGTELVVVISAMGKTTNALEKISSAYIEEGKNSQTALALIEKLKEAHAEIANELFEGNIPESVLLEFTELEKRVACRPVLNDQYIYDQIVSKGELISTKIVSEYLQKSGVENEWLDVRDCIFTNRNFREGIVDWKKTEQQLCEAYRARKSDLIITQGFLGGTAEGMTTTLGREGSDYSAAIFAHCLDAEDLSIWKDVSGVLSADPRKFEQAELIHELSYRQAMQMTYHGAKVIHHKTLKPLFEKNIPLFVRSFSNPKEKGTCISKSDDGNSMPAFVVHLDNLAMVRIERKNQLPISELDLARIYEGMSKTYNHACFNLREACAVLI